MLVHASVNHTYSGRRKKKVVSRKFTKPFREYRPKRDSRITREYASLQTDNGVCARNTIMDNLHLESTEVREEILAKSTRLAPAFNKGAVQYITEGSDPRFLGKKYEC